jgi:hypothetical protein
MLGDSRAHDLSPIVAEDDHHVEQPKRHSGSARMPGIALKGEASTLRARTPNG